ncbi:HK97 family phage prohead protease [Archangium violaceum]|nr:HK97 family phage prohead protease [Archangium violaceum]QRK08070.1 HK97 family phage prohead protease [Archangium violaceum]
MFAMLDPPGVDDAHGDTMDAGALRLPEGVNEVPLYWVHSYHVGIVPDASPEQRLPVGSATVWEEEGQWYFVPCFNLLTDLSQKVKGAVDAGDIAACSIGYRTVRATPNGKGPDGKGEDVHEARLLEVSLVDVGAKAGAVRIKMADEPKKPEEKKPEPPAVDMADLYTMVKAIHAKMFPPESEAKPPESEGKATEPPATKDDKPQTDVPQDESASENEAPPSTEDEDPVTKWLRSLAA